eukprot:gene3425-5360_t
MARHSKVVRWLGGVAAVGLAGGCYCWFDYTTQHKMRRLKKKWNPSDAGVRLVNIVTAPVRPAMTLGELARLDGGGHRTYFAGAGFVFDASGSEAFRRAYPAWAGRDASYSLATMSLAAEDVGRTDWGSLTDKERRVLDDWGAYFMQRFPCIATLSEWDAFVVADAARP